MTCDIILNPKTNRYVKRDGRIGKLIDREFQELQHKRLLGLFEGNNGLGDYIISMLPLKSIITYYMVRNHSSFPTTSCHSLKIHSITSDPPNIQKIKNLKPLVLKPRAFDMFLTGSYEQAPFCIFFAFDREGELEEVLMQVKSASKNYMQYELVNSMVYCTSFIATTAAMLSPSPTDILNSIAKELCPLSPHDFSKYSAIMATRYLNKPYRNPCLKSAERQESIVQFWHKMTHTNKDCMNINLVKWSIDPVLDASTQKLMGFEVTGYGQSPCDFVVYPTGVLELSEAETKSGDARRLWELLYNSFTFSFGNMLHISFLARALKREMQQSFSTDEYSEAHIKELLQAVRLFKHPHVHVKCAEERH